jgi:hypothetical protein
MTSISSSAMLVNLSISVYTGRKQDKKTASEVNTAKGAGSSKASSVNKHLFADDPDLEAIVAFGAKCRAYLYSITLPWSDTGTRLLPTSAYLDFTAELGRLEAEFHALVDKFVKTYDIKVSAQAFKLGGLFNRAEYPNAEDIRYRFAFRPEYSPVPEAGDFRVDIPAQAQAALKASFSTHLDSKLQQAIAEPWERIYEQVKHIRAKLIDTPEGKAQRLYTSMLENALNLTATLGHLNVLGDPKLDDAKRELERSLENISIDSLRESPELRASLAVKMKDFSDKFNLEM